MTLQDYTFLGKVLDNKTKLRCDFGLVDMAGHSLLWLIFGVITFGLALFIAPYYFESMILKKTKILDGHNKVIGYLECDFTLMEVIGHAFIWILLSLVTLGLALVFYWFYMKKFIMNKTEIIKI